jgi:hypothetical protein
MYQEYKPRHPLAWGIIAGVALFSAVAVGAIKGWLPLGDSGFAFQACAECAVVQSVRTVETPIEPIVPELAGGEMPADASAVAPDAAVESDAADAAAMTPEPVAQFAFSYETTVRFEDGSTSVISQAEPPTWRPGDEVKVVDGLIVVSG